MFLYVGHVGVAIDMFRWLIHRPSTKAFIDVAAAQQDLSTAEAAFQALKEALGAQPENSAEHGLSLGWFKLILGYWGGFSEGRSEGNQVFPPKNNPNPNAGGYCTIFHEKILNMRA